MDAYKWKLGKVSDILLYRFPRSLLPSVLLSVGGERRAATPSFFTRWLGIEHWSLRLVKKLPALQGAYGTVQAICKLRLFSNQIKFVCLFIYFR